MWTDTHYYRFPTQAEQEAMPLPETCAVDVVGVIFTAEGEARDGWHVNARWWGAEPEAWEAFQIPSPTNPVRVFA